MVLSSGWMAAMWTDVNGGSILYVAKQGVQTCNQVCVLQHTHAGSISSFDITKSIVEASCNSLANQGENAGCVVEEVLLLPRERLLSVEIEKVLDDQFGASARPSRRFRLNWMAS